MKKITKIIRNEIFELFEKYPYYGKIEIIDFLKRLYDLENLISYDSRVKNAENDIIRHTYNGDYDDNWIFNDDRFELAFGEDEILLNFLCEVFHPEVRNEKEDWKNKLKEVNRLLQDVGYKLIVSSKFSGRDVFGWKIYDNNEVFPFSQRNKELINKKNNIKISNDIRYQIFSIMEDYNNLNCYSKNKKIGDCVIEDIKKFYIPKHYKDNKYIEVKKFEDFERGTKPFLIFDVIEIFNKYLYENGDFENKINQIFKLNNLNIEFNEGLIFLFEDDYQNFKLNANSKEEGINELLKEAERLYMNGKFSYAVEKIWDAFERIKTYYYPTLDKKSSIEKIIKDLSCGNEEIMKIYNKEMKELTIIGNSYQIRHYELNKIKIEKEIHYKYLYKRNLVLIATIIDSLQ